jgi:hypothetical protein
MITGSVKVTAPPIVIVPVPVLRPMVIELKPSAKALILAEVTWQAPVPPAIPISIPSVAGCSKRVLEPETLPPKEKEFAFNVKALTPPATVLPKVMLLVPTAIVVAPPSVTAPVLIENALLVVV